MLKRFFPLCLLLILFFQCFYSAWFTGQTTDETFYSGSGYGMLRRADYRYLAEHPPLAIELGALPLILAGIHFPYDNPVLLPSGAVDLSKTGEKFLYQSGNNPQIVLFLERLPSVLFTLLLALVLFCWAKNLYGCGGGILALFLFCVCPNILAHGTLYTTDMAVTFFFFAAIWRAGKFFQKTSLKNSVLTGFFIGCALMSKISAVILIPVLLGIAFIFLIDSRRENSEKTPVKKHSAWTGFVIIGLTALAVILFGFLDFPDALQKLKPFSHYTQVFRASIAHSRRFHEYCLGGSFVTCDWKYFPALLLIKTPVLSLLLMVAGIFTWPFLKKSKLQTALVFLPPLAFLAAACFMNHIHIGLRHVLPIYPFLYLIAGAVMPVVSGCRSAQIRIFFLWVLFIVGGFTVFRHIRQVPYYLSYFNEFIGREEEGAALTMDSNIDWGQDNRRLAELALKLGNPGMQIMIGAANAAEYDYYKMRWQWADAAEFKNPPPGYYALDLLTYLEQTKKKDSWFYQRRPNFIAGRTIYVFIKPES